MQKLLLAVILVVVIIAFAIVAGVTKNAKETGDAPDLRAIVTDNFNPNGIFTPEEPMTAPAENIFATNVPPETLTPAVDIVANEGDILNLDEMTFIADYNGIQKEVNGWDIVFSSNATKPLSKGKNTIMMTYRDTTYAFIIEVGNAENIPSIFDADHNETTAPVTEETIPEISITSSVE